MTTSATPTRSAAVRRAGPVRNRLRRAGGQLTGILAMYETGRHPSDLLDQIAAARAAEGTPTTS